MDTPAPTGAYRAEVLDERDHAHSARLVHLREACAITLDQTHRQIEALAALPRPFDGDPTETRWVHYPWRSALVRLLAPTGFNRLRLDRNRHKITDQEQERARTLSIGVVGLSVGHAVAHTLALEGLCGRIRLADFDQLELSNLNRVPGTVLELGVNKAVSAARRIAELDPYLVVEVLEDAITEGTIDAFLDGLDLVAEECDSFDAKVLVRDRARSAGIPVIMETSDGGVLDVERFDLEPDRPLFHGLVGDLDRERLTRMSPEEKVPFALEILDGGAITPRMAASALELGRTLTTWPQTGGDVALGGASVAAAARRLVRGQPLPSGRIRVDLDVALDDLGSGASTTDGSDSSDIAGPVPTAEATGPDSRAVPQPVDPIRASRGMDAVTTVLHAGARAPSLGNMQPWRFHLADGTLSLHPAPAANLPDDLAGRATLVSLGGAWFSATVAARAMGLRGTSELRGDLLEPRPTVDLTVAEGADLSVSPDEGTLHSLLGRRTVRAPGDGLPLRQDELAAIRGGMLASLPGDEVPPRLHQLDAPAELTTLADLLGQSERIRFLTPRLHQDWVTRHPRAAGEVGVSDAERALAPAQVPMQTLLRRPEVMDLLREWGAGHALGADAAARVGSASAAVVVLAADGSAGAHVRAGWAATDLWVRASAAGLAVYPMTPVFLHAEPEADLASLAPHHPVELAELAARFRSLIGATGAEVPAMLLLLSHSSAPGPISRRRAIDDLTL